MKSNDFFSGELSLEDKEDKLFQREVLKMDITEELLCWMEEREISKTALAKILGKSKSNVSRQLDGSRNMTLSSLSDICFALEIKPKVKFEDKRLIENKGEHIFVYVDNDNPLKYSEAVEAINSARRQSLDYVPAEVA